MTVGGTRGSRLPRPELGQEGVRPRMRQLAGRGIVKAVARGHVDDAEVLYRRALDLIGRHLGAGHPTTVTCRANQGRSASA